MDNQLPGATPPISDDVQKNKVNAVLAYFGLLILIPLLTAKESEFAQFHANQGLILIIANVIVGIVWVIPILGWIAGFFAGVALFIFTIMGIINALKGEMKEIPLIGHYRLLN